MRLALIIAFCVFLSTVSTQTVSTAIRTYNFTMSGKYSMEWFTYIDDGTGANMI